MDEQQYRDLARAICTWFKIGRNVEVRRNHALDALAGTVVNARSGENAWQILKPSLPGNSKLRDPDLRFAVNAIAHRHRLDPERAFVDFVRWRLSRQNTHSVPALYFNNFGAPGQISFTPYAPGDQSQARSYLEAELRARGVRFIDTATAVDGEIEAALQKKGAPFVLASTHRDGPADFEQAARAAHDPAHHLEALHDCYLEVTGNSISDPELKALLDQLPAEIKTELDTWGFDTLVSDQVHAYLVETLNEDSGLKPGG